MKKSIEIIKNYSKKTPDKELLMKIIDYLLKQKEREFNVKGSQDI
jgi:hypothetical protein